MSVEIKLSRVDKVYRPGDIVSGVLAVVSKGTMSYVSITLQLEGEVTMQLSAKSVGLFEAFYNSIKPIKLIDYRIEISKSGKFYDGVSEIPFEFKLEPLSGQELYETYHGVFVSIGYTLTCDIVRSVFAKNIQKKMEFIVEVPTSQPYKKNEVAFEVTPTDLDNIRQNTVAKVPHFLISGTIRSAVCEINKPFMGELVIKESSAPIRSIELQLVRVETCGCADGFAKEATEIQNIQICDGDVCRGLTIPIYMLFPRLFTCPTIAARTFKIEFEVNLVVMFNDGHLLSQNFPITLTREK